MTMSAHKIPDKGTGEFNRFCMKWNILPVVSVGNQLKAYCLTTRQYIGDATRLIEFLGTPLMYWNEYDLATHKKNGMVVKEDDE